MTSEVFSDPISLYWTLLTGFLSFLYSALKMNKTDSNNLLFQLQTKQNWLEGWGFYYYRKISTTSLLYWAKVLEQEWFTCRNLELCVWQRSFSVGTSFHPQESWSYAYNCITSCHLGNVSNPKKVQFVRHITLGLNHSWLESSKNHFFYVGIGLSCSLLGFNNLRS